jgi:4-hydroxyacetophenone monooxygenase
MRTMLASYLEQQFHDRPDLLPYVVPTYPPGAKRLLRDNGVWAATLKRDNVTLVTETIREITPSGVVTADGVEHDVDVIVYGTGFQASHFLTPMQITGRGGVDLHEQWAGDARSPRVTIPGFRTSSASTGRTPTPSSTQHHLLRMCARYILVPELLLRGRHRARGARTSTTS